MRDWARGVGRWSPARPVDGAAECLGSEQKSAGRGPGRSMLLPGHLRLFGLGFYECRWVSVRMLLSVAIPACQFRCRQCAHLCVIRTDCGNVERLRGVLG